MIVSGWFGRALRSRHGAATLEYALLGGFIGAVLVASLTSLGTQLRSTFTMVIGLI